MYTAVVPLYPPGTDIWVFLREDMGGEDRYRWVRGIYESVLTSRSGPKHGTWVDIGDGLMGRHHAYGEDIMQRFSQDIF